MTVASITLACMHIMRIFKELYYITVENVSKCSLSSLDLDTALLYCITMLLEDSLI